MADLNFQSLVDDPFIIFLDMRGNYDMKLFCETTNGSMKRTFSGREIVLVTGLAIMASSYDSANLLHQAL
jgi:hypothetical protein